MNIFRASEYIVLYGELKSFYPNNADTPISVLEFLKNSMRSNTLIEVSDEFVQHYLDSGRCIILLDALDEVDKTKRDSLHESVASFFKKQNPNNKVYFNCKDEYTSDSKIIKYGDEDYVYEGNCEVWRIIGVFDVDNGKGSVEKRLKLINTLIHSSFWTSNTRYATNRKE